MNFKNFDWRRLQRYFSPQAAGDLNVFLERLPQNVGNTVLIAAGIAWAAGAGLGLVATVQIKKVTEVRAELAKDEAAKPNVPRIKDAPVKQDEIKGFAETLAATYPGLMVKQQGPSIYITSNSTANFGQFREAVGHVQNGGSGWRVSLERLCVGRECDKDKLAALLKISKVSVE